VDDQENKMLLNLLFAYKRLFIRFEELKYLSEHPELPPEKVKDVVFEEVDALFRPLDDALSADRPIRERLQAFVEAVDRESTHRKLS
jgi:hypothetical protein